MTLIESSTFYNNSAKNYAGCFYVLAPLVDNSEIIIDGSYFVSNIAVDGGVGYILNLNKLIVKNSNFTGNLAR